MKKMISMLFCALLLLSMLPMSALAESKNEWICSDCHIWVSGNYCPQCTKTRPANAGSANECMMTFRINFKKNHFFSRYDAEIVINGMPAFTVEHGGTLDGTVVVPKGECEVVFRNASDPSEDLRFTLKLTGDTTFSADLSAHFYGLNMTNVTCSAFQGNQNLGVRESGTRNGARMTVMGITKGRGSNFMSAADGYVFVWVEFEVVNTTNHTLMFKPKYDFSCYCDGYTIQPSSRSAAAAPMEFESSLGAGEKMKAMLCFELPTNWQELRIVYGNEDVVFDRLVYVLNNR